MIAQNKSARHNYFIEDTYECGVVLTGTEVKSLRAGRASLLDGFAHIQDGEIWLSGVHIPEYTEGTWNNHPPRRDRKLLLNKREIVKLIGIMKSGGLTLVPLSLYFKDGKAKIEIAVAKEKRLTINVLPLKRRRIIVKLLGRFREILRVRVLQSSMKNKTIKVK